ncbi:hypothetical protein DR192_02655 [Lawsonia intracellularis]|uniref:hypothetical protein n=1 Tax=Lawsonia intracellularis TaxID=29546 RepID=UPI000DE528DB|nr:hypothetical protein [Lawsonia intracellularis]RBN35249.1 hypothetical protein DR192_02655 [Lawsonia intracellularis]RBN35491.1 hypothetical protein DR193_00600 [Lawsonia intracellularis]
MVNSTSHYSSDIYISNPMPIAPHNRPRENTNRNRGRRIFLALISLGMTELARLALRAYRTRHTPNNNTPQVRQAQIAQYNLQIIDSHLDPNKLPMFPRVKENVIMSTSQFFEGIDVPNPKNFIDSALQQLRNDITNYPKLSEKMFKELLSAKLNDTVLKEHIINKVTSQISTTSDVNLGPIVQFLLTKFNSEIEGVLTGPPSMLKESIEELNRHIIISTKNIIIQEKVIDKCIETGLKAVLNALNATPQEVMALPRQTILTKLYTAADNIEKTANQKNGTPTEIPACVYEKILSQLSDSFYSTIIQAGILTNAATKDSHITMILLEKSMHIVSNSNISPLIEKITQSPEDIKEKKRTAIQLSRLLCDQARTVFNNEWDIYPSNKQNLILSVVYLLTKLNHPQLQDTTVREQLSVLAKEIDKDGLNLAKKLSQANSNEAAVTRLMAQSNFLSKTLIMILSFIGGKGYGLE